MTFVEGLYVRKYPYEHQLCRFSRALCVSRGTRCGQSVRNRRAFSQLTCLFSDLLDWSETENIVVHWEAGELARGSFGVVYAGEHRGTGTPVVIKAAPADDAFARSLLETERYINRKLRDKAASNGVVESVEPFRWARYVGDVRLPNMSPPTAVARQCAPMALVWQKEGSGETLENFLSGKPAAALAQALGTSDTSPGSVRLFRSTFRRVVGELLKALVQLQEWGIMHRDVKPANILVVPRAADDAPLKLIDFGSACDWRSFWKRGFDPDRATCDPLYAAPELFISPLRPDRFDVFSVGLIGLRVLVPTLHSEDRLRECVTLLRTRYQWDIEAWVADQVKKSARSRPVLQALSTTDNLAEQVALIAEDPALLQLLRAMLRESPFARVSAGRALELYNFDAALY
jgi:serine/threonine protein kinase